LSRNICRVFNVVCDEFEVDFLWVCSQLIKVASQCAKSNSRSPRGRWQSSSLQDILGLIERDRFGKTKINFPRACTTRAAVCGTRPVALSALSTKEHRMRTNLNDRAYRKSSDAQGLAAQILRSIVGLVRA